MAVAHEKLATHLDREVRSSRFELRRRLASPDEVLTSFTAASKAERVGKSTHWTDARVVCLRLPERGSVTVAPSAFYTVMAFVGKAPEVAGDEDGSATRSSASPHQGSTLVHGLGAGLRYTWTNSHRVHWVCLEPRLVVDVAAQCGMANAELRDLPTSIQERDAACEYLVGALVEEAGRDYHAAQSLTIESIVHALACRAVTRLVATPPKPVGPRGALNTRALRDVREYIDAHLGARISLGDLARVAGVSRFHFARQFRLRTHESPMGYVLRARIERAKADLRETSVRIAEIAAALGFADQSHFTRTFKRVTGVPPSAFSRGVRSARMSKLRADDSMPADAECA